MLKSETEGWKGERIANNRGGQAEHDLFNPNLPLLTFNTNDWSCSVKRQKGADVSSTPSICDKEIA